VRRARRPARCCWAAVPAQRSFQALRLSESGSIRPLRATGPRAGAAAPPGT
jgi:hypothetical protein